MHARANTLEALIGSVFLDGGLETVRAVLARLLFPEKVVAIYIITVCVMTGGTNYLT